MKLCKNCKFFSSPLFDLKWGSDKYRFAICNHPKIKDIRSSFNPVNGKTTTEQLGFCGTSRKFNHLCGEDAKFYTEGN